MAAEDVTMDVDALWQALGRAGKLGVFGEDRADHTA
jgi:hypothetical protein